MACKSGYYNDQEQNQKNSSVKIILYYFQEHDTSDFLLYEPKDRAFWQFPYVSGHQNDLTGIFFAAEAAGYSTAEFIDLSRS